MPIDGSQGERDSDAPSRRRRTIFIGHGRSRIWQELKPLLRSKGFQSAEFNDRPIAGHTAKERLERMLDESAYALLLLTAEDEHLDGQLHARENVIHEAGLFQGRLGFKNAIILVEEGCSTFSNIAGLQTINFKKGDVGSAFPALRRQLEHWNGGGEATTGLWRDPAPSPGFSIWWIALTAAMVLCWRWLVGGLGWRFLFVVPVCAAAIYAARWVVNRLRESGRSRRVRSAYARGRRPFRDMQLTRALLADVVLAGADFSQSILYRAVLTRSDLREARLRKTDLRDAQMEAINGERADLTEAVLIGTYLATANLRRAILKGATLVEAYLSRAVLQEATLQGTDLRGASLQHADLRGASLQHADLRGAVMAHADLRGADLRYADLRGADLLGADLRGANVRRADLAESTIDQAMLDDDPVPMVSS